MEEEKNKYETPKQQMAGEPGSAGATAQGILERGCKTGSFSYLLWPCRVGAFSGGFISAVPEPSGDFAFLSGSP